MKSTMKWLVLGILMLSIFIMTLMRTPEQITDMLVTVSAKSACLAVANHLIFLAVVVAGLAFKRIRGWLFFGFMALISLSATLVAIKHVILPNIVIFGLLFILIIQARIAGRLNFDLKIVSSAGRFFGAVGLLFAFWYLHWVDDPIWLNAMIYSPIGVVNCPTLVAVCAFLALATEPRSAALETTAALITLYFGFFGLLRFDASVYVDVVLILCALFLIVRLGARVWAPNLSDRVKTGNYADLSA